MNLSGTFWKIRDLSIFEEALVLPPQARGRVVLPLHRLALWPTATAARRDLCCLQPRASSPRRCLQRQAAVRHLPVLRGSSGLPGAAEAAVRTRCSGEQEAQEQVKSFCVCRQESNTSQSCLKHLR